MIIDTIENQDCLTILRKMPDACVDMVFADPPFNLNKKYKSSKDNLSHEDYMSWSEEWIAHCVRILKPHGSIFVHNIPKWLLLTSPILEKHAFFKHWISWDAPTAPMGKSLQPGHYGVLYYAKQAKPKFYEIRHPHKRCRKKKCRTLHKDYGGKISMVHPFGPLVSDVWSDIHRVKHNRDSHPCQLPVHLLERIILMSTDEGDIVFDPFMGTGTTALASKRLGRHFYGTELDAGYHAIAIKRAAEEKHLSRLDDVWISAHRESIVTIRHTDWDKVADCFIIHGEGRALDYRPIELKDHYRKALPKSPHQQRPKPMEADVLSFFQ